MEIHKIVSAAFLIGLTLTLAVPVAIAFNRPSEYTWWERILYGPVYCLARILWRVEVVGVKSFVEAYPHGAVIVANHRCSLDPCFIQLAAGRRVHWMVAGEYFRHPIFGLFLQTVQAIPTNRSGADNAAMKMAIRLASQGRYIGMFPEGRINRTAKPLQSIRPGAALVAAKAGVPLLPCWIEGAPSGWAVWSGLFMPAHVRIRVGQPIPIDAAAETADESIVRAMRAALALGGYSREAVTLSSLRSRRQGWVRQ
jgi:1-acyl-sn-glycerol-3-phosphate acyltransferase